MSKYVCETRGWSRNQNAPQSPISSPELGIFQGTKRSPELDKFNPGPWLSSGGIFQDEAQVHNSAQIGLLATSNHD